ncbi:MAG: hypothetical protein HY821_16095 [Acidobacteria bacterium]|nr:hypothetical protein [Acidobacteriota bacterium]
MGNIPLLATFILAVATVWLAVMRPRMRLDNSWPLLYYLSVVLYLNGVPQVLNSYVVYVAVVCALLIRFEFMNARIVLLVRTIELLALAHIAWTLSAALIKDVS